MLPLDERVERHIRLLDRQVDAGVGDIAIEIDGRRHRINTDIVHLPLGLDARRRRAPSPSTPAARPVRLTSDAVPRFVLHDAQAEGGGPICPLPGTVIAVHVAAGDSVTDGQVLMVVEAMKMEHKIVASGDATVSDIRFAVGDRVDQGDLLVALDHSEEM